jgi:hypothetical protein
LFLFFVFHYGILFLLIIIKLIMHYFTLVFVHGSYFVTETLQFDFVTRLIKLCFLWFWLQRRRPRYPGQRAPSKVKSMDFTLAKEQNFTVYVDIHEKQNSTTRNKLIV